MVPQAMELLKKWNFKYATTMFVWNKLKDGKAQALEGTFSDGSTEYLWAATKGQV